MRSWLEVRHGRLLIRVADRAASYPLRIDPVLSASEHTASNGGTDDELGYSVAISGSTIVVGARGHNEGRGAAYVFSSVSGAWQQTAELTASDAAPGNQFGWSVAIAGKTIAVGSPSRPEGGVYTFEESGGSWTQTGEIYDPEKPANDRFGYSVALSGETLAVGVLGKTQSNTLQGEVYVFSNASGHWKETAKLTASDAEEKDELGYSVAISGNTIVAGAPDKNKHGAGVEGIAAGAAYVFKEQSGTWTEVEEITPTDFNEGDFFGLSVAVSGNTIAVGSPFHLGFQGAAYIFNEGVKSPS